MRPQRIMKSPGIKIYLMELIIVVVGITIAFQVNVWYEARTSNRLELNALLNLEKELSINIQEFESLKSYRERITNSSEILLKAFNEHGKLEKELTEAHLFNLVQTSTPDLQNNTTRAYLENESFSHTELKNELLQLQTYLQELTEMSQGYLDRKGDVFMDALFDDVDFPNGEILSMRTINSTRFKNILWNLTTDEYELNRLYDQARSQLDHVYSMTKKLITSYE